MTPVDPLPYDDTPWSARLADVAERVVFTFVETVLGLLIVTGVGDVGNLKVAAVAGIAAVLSLIKNVLTEWLQTTNARTWWADTIERTIMTYLQTLLALLIVDGNLVLSDWKGAVYAAVPAALAVLKAAMAHFVGNPNTASFVRTAKGDYPVAA